MKDLRGEKVVKEEVETIPKHGINYVLPQRLSKKYHKILFLVFVLKCHIKI